MHSNPIEDDISRLAPTWKKALHHDSCVIGWWFPNVVDWKVGWTSPARLVRRRHALVMGRNCRLVFIRFFFFLHALVIGRDGNVSQSATLDVLLRSKINRINEDIIASQTRHFPIQKTDLFCTRTIYFSVVETFFQNESTLVPSTMKNLMIYFRKRQLLIVASEENVKPEIVFWGLFYGADARTDFIFWFTIRNSINALLLNFCHRFPRDSSHQSSGQLLSSEKKHGRPWKRKPHEDELVGPAAGVGLSSRCFVVSSAQWELETHQSDISSSTFCLTVFEVVCGSVTGRRPSWGFSMAGLRDTECRSI